MSLINEALKKAQAQRQSTPTPGEPPSPSGPPHSVTAHGSGPTGWLVAGLLLAITLVFAVGASLIVWGLRGSDEPDAPPDVASARTEPAPDSPMKENAEGLPPIEFKIQETTAEPVPQTVAAPNPPPPQETVQEKAPATSAAPKPPAPAPAPTDNASAPAAQSPSAAPAAATQGTGAQEPAPVPTTHRVNPNPEVEAYLSALEVRGVMSGGQKALIYNTETERSRAYAAGSTISNELQIKIQAITENSISFVDYDGYVYTKSF